LFAEAARFSSLAVRNNKRELLLATLGAIFIAYRVQGAYAFPGTFSLVLDAARRLGVDPSEVVDPVLRASGDPELHSHVRHFLNELPRARRSSR
jgi:hypothetical protein